MYLHVDKLTRKMNELNISLNQDPASSCYAPGSAVAGHLNVVASEPRRYWQISMFLIGRGTVYWEDEQAAGQTYTTKQPYVEQQVVVWRSENSANATFPPGLYTYPFQFTLPINCPSSFHSDIGKIEYKVKAVVFTGTGQIKQRVPIEVVEVINAGTSVAVTPARIEERVRVSGWCCKTGEITLNVQMQRSRYNVGEEIPVGFYIENGSGKQLSVECELLETIDFFATGKYSQITTHITTSTRATVDPHTSSGEQYMMLRISPRLRPAMTQAGIIQSRHSIDVTLEIPGSTDQVYKFPVTIGNTNHRY